MGLAQKGLSKLKMVALIPGKEENITWYSPIWQNHKQNEIIIEGMLRRFKTQPQASRVNTYQFFENEVLVYELKRQ